MNLTFSQSILDFPDELIVDPNDFRFRSEVSEHGYKKLIQYKKTTFLKDSTSTLRPEYMLEFDSNYRVLTFRYDIVDGTGGAVLENDQLSLELNNGMLNLVKLEVEDSIKFYNAYCVKFEYIKGKLINMRFYEPFRDIYDGVYAPDIIYSNKITIYNQFENGKMTISKIYHEGSLVQEIRYEYFYENGLNGNILFKKTEITKNIIVERYIEFSL
tara:strand:+ start:54 stop:695 length:642 start_codon:yes stop_codon:yes gene_type:complete